MVVILRLRNKIILYAFILLCFMILSYSIYNIVKWKLDSNNTNKQIEEADIDYVATDCETCKWQIEMSTSKACEHPITILAKALE